jgi:cobalt/nickel transport system ATP-binding protein
MMEASGAIFEVRNAGFSYPGGVVGLVDASLTVAVGERIALLGANASGKSTLLQLLDGLQFAQTGSVLAFGTKLTEAAAETPPFSRFFRRQVGFLFQNSDVQLFSPTVEDEIAFGPLQLRLPQDEVRQRVEDMLQILGLQALRDRAPHTLSGGEKKRVALASLLSVGPSVLLLDEPTTGLDPRSQQALLELVAELHHAGLTTITATHDLGFAAEIASQAVVLSEEHRIVRDAPMREVLGDLDLLLQVNLIHSHAHEHGSYTHVHPHAHTLPHEHGGEPGGPPPGA